MHRLPDGPDIVQQFRDYGQFARLHGLRLTFHPDQFVLLNSPRAAVLEHSMRQLEYHAQMAAWVGADVITLHAGGAYGDPRSALQRLTRTLQRLPESIRALLALENDDQMFGPSALLPVCAETGVPFVYDVHHHRCLPDELSEAEATVHALETWNREPLFHLSSPLHGWKGPTPYRHHDFIRPEDFPLEWLRLNVTIEVEAKAKELAVLRLLRRLRRRGVCGPPLGQQTRTTARLKGNRVSRPNPFFARSASAPSLDSFPLERPRTDLPRPPTLDRAAGGADNGPAPTTQGPRET